ncbi:APC family permease [Algoriphagus confluentis]|uniref:APC family permease n=1 Tax=Algoriphagus confluentis TaxID=1697556 RepID=A0ABQ6PQB1_9BACT|nr:APC family permease [Algoriphagus confluentis]
MKTSQEGLKREVGVWGLSANIVNIMVGAGIFVLPAIISETMGASGVLAYLFCGLLIALVMLCFAEAGSKITQSGGGYAYVEKAFGPFMGLVVAVFYIVAGVFSIAAVSNALIEILGTAVPLFKISGVRIGTLFLLFFGLAGLNIMGIKQGIGLVKLNTLAKLLPLILLISFGWKDVAWGNLSWQTEPTVSNLGSASLVLFFAFMGGDSGLQIGGEIKTPHKTIPRAIFIAISFVVVLYILIQLVAQGVLGNALPGFKEAPLGEAAGLIFGPIGFSLFFVGAGISMFGMLSGEILNTPRTIFRLSRDGIFPVKKLASVHHRFKTPHFAILCYAGMGFTMASIGGFQTLAAIAASSLLTSYLIVSLSIIGLRRKKEYKNIGFEIPFGFTVPVLSAGVILYFLSNLSGMELSRIFILTGFLALIYFSGKSIKKWRQRNQ